MKAYICYTGVQDLEISAFARYDQAAAWREDDGTPILEVDIDWCPELYGRTIPAYAPLHAGFDALLTAAGAWADGGKPCQGAA